MTTELKQITNLDGLKGKTIAATHMGYDEIWLGFSDGSFAIFNLEHGYYDSVSLRLSSKPPDLTQDTQGTLKLKLVSVETLKALVAEKQAAETARRAAFERAEFERLRAKYGN